LHCRNHLDRPTQAIVILDGTRSMEMMNAAETIFWLLDVH